MAVRAQLKEAAALLNAGRDLEAATLCEALLQSHSGDAAALQLLGVALTRLARPLEALPWLRRALELGPASFSIYRDLGNAHRAAGDLAAATVAYRAALRLESSDVASRFRLAETLADMGDMQGAVEHFGYVALRNAMDFEATQRFVNCVAALPGEEDVAFAAPTPRHNQLGRVAVAMCTADPERAAVAQAGLQRALSPAPAAFHIVTGARSLAEAFNHVLDETEADVVILCHDDIAIASPNIQDALARALHAADLVGVAGAVEVTGPAVLWAGHPHVHGWVSYPREDAIIEAAPLSLRSGIIGGMKALDGVFIAMTGRAARELRFDDATFDGFHFYDLDFTYRAWQSGFRMAVTTEILLLHASEGKFDAAWSRYAERFQRKFPALSAAARAPHWYGARCRDLPALRAFYRRLDAQVAALRGPG